MIDPRAAGFNAGHALAIGMLIQEALQQEPTGDAKADKAMSLAIERAYEVMTWLEPLIKEDRAARGLPDA